jgi:hypothetical protein
MAYKEIKQQIFLPVDDPDMDKDDVVYERVKKAEKKRRERISRGNFYGV